MTCAYDKLPTRSNFIRIKKVVISMIFEIGVNLQPSNNAENIGYLFNRGEKYGDWSSNKTCNKAWC